MIFFFFVTLPSFIIFLQSTGDTPDTGDVLTLTNITHEMEGWYTCVAGNSLGMTSASAYLRVVDGKFLDCNEIYSS